MGDSEVSVTASPRILVIDNYDSFVFNLVQYLAQLGAQVTVKRNDEVTVEECLTYDGVLISPGPGTPKTAGICLDVVKETHGQVPIFGVCLGHQVIAEAFGGEIHRAPELLHGKTSQVHHNKKGVLRTLPPAFTATRYHSLALNPETVPEELEVTGSTESGLKVCSFTRSQFSPKVGTRCSPTGWKTAASRRHASASQILNRS
jgi:para-aminobenzoate synthetase component 2